MKKEALVILCLVISMAYVSLPFGIVNASPETIVFVHDPVTQGDVSSAAVGQTFTVEVRVSDVANLIAFEFWMKWNTTLLDLVSVKEGPFLNLSGAYQSFFTPKIPGDSGWAYTDQIYVLDVLLGGSFATSASGSGVLAKITFEALDDGIGTLDLHDSVLAGYYTYGAVDIPHSSADGYFAFPLPIAFVDPEAVTGVLPGESFNITVAVVDIVKAYNLTFKLGWDKTKLNATAILEEPFLSSQGATSFHSSIDQDNGILYVNNTLTGEPLTGISGNGVLAKITFLVEARGSTDLTLFDVRLFMQDGSVSPAAAESSTFTNTQRDVAVTDGSLSTSSVSKGQAVGITVVVKNKGVEDETFTVKFEYSGQSIASLPVTSLVPGDTQTLTYQWDTSNVEAGTYTVKATIVETIPGEVNRADNTRTLGDITITGGGGIDMTLLIVGAVIAIVVVVAVVVFLFLRRRK